MLLLRWDYGFLKKWPVRRKLQEGDNRCPLTLITSAHNVNRKSSLLLAGNSELKREINLL
jgi:hypothetical protein